MQPVQKQPPAAMCDKVGGRSSSAHDGLERFSSLARQIFCNIVVHLRFAGVPAQRFVGITLDLHFHKLVWSGASSLCFFDGPLLFILGTVVTPILLGVLSKSLIGMFRVLCCRRVKRKID